MDEIVILSGARTAIGTFGGSLAGNPLLSEVATHVTKAAIERAGIAPAQIRTVVFGRCHQHRTARCLSLARGRHAGGISGTTRDERQPPLWLGRAGDRLGHAGAGAEDADFALAGGAEGMSRAPYIVPRVRRPEDGRCGRAGT